MGGDPFVFGINYRMPSEAAFYLPGQPQTYALFLNYKASEYMFWENPDALKGRDAVFINDTDTQDHFDDLRAVFARVEPQPPLLDLPQSALRRADPHNPDRPLLRLQRLRCQTLAGRLVNSAVYAFVFVRAYSTYRPSSPRRNMVLSSVPGLKAKFFLLVGSTESTGSAPAPRQTRLWTVCR